MILLGAFMFDNFIFTYYNSILDEEFLRPYEPVVCVVENFIVLNII